MTENLRKALSDYNAYAQLPKAVLENLVYAIIAAAKKPDEKPDYQSQGWLEVFATLEDVAPGWCKHRADTESVSGTACKAIREAFAERDLLRTEVRRLQDLSLGHIKENQELKHKLAELEKDLSGLLQPKMPAPKFPTNAELGLPDPDGWTPWDGGECPVHSETIVDVKYRAEHTNRRPAGDFWWDHKQSPGDIIAYRVTKPVKHPTRSEIIAAYEYAGIVPEKWPWCAMDDNKQWAAYQTEPDLGDVWWVNYTQCVKLTLPPVADWKQSKRRVAS